MMCGNARDIFWGDYKKYGYTDADFADEESNVVANANWEEVEQPDIKLIDKSGNQIASGKENVFDTILDIGCRLAKEE